ncbi:MAG TPA: HNH endonuclease [Companilactobacillus farciminis]|uniref:HNH endonuclease n=1 Tax=Companilactobacillus farciminis TaxID=1612 RepID=A0A921LAG1_9LACO|nr:HNH endonuclease [Companilactobacillus farciminis]
MRSKVVENGHLKIFEDGTVYRKKNNIWTEIKPTVSYLGNGKGKQNRKLIAYQDNKKQYHVMVDRLVAQAFIPGETKYGVTHIDGNTLNCNVKNLRWRTKKDLQRIGRQSNKKYFKKLPVCVVCHETRQTESQSVCSKCLLAFERSRKRNASLRKRKSELSKLYSLELNDKQKRIIDMRGGGMSLQQIADEFEMTREGVRIAIKNLLNKYDRVEKLLKELKKPDEKSLYLMSLAELGRYLNVSRPIVYRMLDEGLPYVVIGKRKKVSKKAAYDWITQRTIGTRNIRKEEQK